MNFQITLQHVFYKTIEFQLILILIKDYRLEDSE